MGKKKVFYKLFCVTFFTPQSVQTKIHLCSNALVCMGFGMESVGLIPTKGLIGINFAVPHFHVRF